MGGQMSSIFTISIIFAVLGMLIPFSDSIAHAEKGDFIVTDPGIGNLLRVTPAGIITIIASPSAIPSGVVIDTNGDFIVTDLGLSGKLQRVTPEGIVTNIALGLDGAVDVVVDTNGDFIVTNALNSKLDRVSPEGVVTTISITLAGPMGVAIDTNGDFIVTEVHKNGLSRVTPEGVVTTIVHRLSGPLGVAVDTNGDFIVTENTSNELSRVTPEGVVTTITSELTDPRGIAVDVNGDFIVVEGTEGKLVRVTPQGVVTTIASGFFSPVDVAIESQLNEKPVGFTIESNGIGGGDWNDISTWVDGVVPTPNDKVIIKNGDIVNVTFSIYIEFFGSITIEQGGKLLITVIENTSVDSKSGESNEHLTRPTFGVSHDTFDSIIDNGFQFNTEQFPITDNHHTDFSEQTINIGEINSFSATVYADKGLKIQEFLFGIPDVGHAHLAELGVEVWYENGEITKVKAVQKSNVIDVDSIVAIHEKAKCQEQDVEANCDTTNISMVFRETLADKIMAIKAIDNKNRYQITYLNEGIGVTGESLNPMNTMLISSNTKSGGQVLITQIAKYSPYWITHDGRLFEKNSFDSFKQINQSFERFEDTGNPYTRMHSEFEKLIFYEQKRATLIFDANELVSELTASFAYVYPEAHERITEGVKKEMLEQEQIAKNILESYLQARW